MTYMETHSILACAMPIKKRETCTICRNETPGEAWLEFKLATRSINLLLSDHEEYGENYTGILFCHFMVLFLMVC
jgi:hypothetical protein